MASESAIGLIGALAWPVIALIALLYIWRSDAIGKLIQISKAVDDLKDQLSAVVEMESRLSRSTAGFTEITKSIEAFQSDLVSMKNDVENIRDKVDGKAEPIAVNPAAEQRDGEQNVPELFQSMEEAWQNLVAALRNKFGWVDGRMVGSEAYSFAHGNRKGPRLSYEQAEEIGLLHSDIKSYRRRQSTMEDWLTQEIAQDFLQSSDNMRAVVDAI